MENKFHYIDLLGKKFEYGGHGPDAYDCYNLCREIYNRLGRYLPPYSSPSEASLIHQIILQGKELLIEIEKPEPYCLVLFMVKPPYTSHIGIVLEDCYRFIHIMQKESVCIERLDSLAWQRRVKGFYRYVG